ncbi:MAG: type II secretion system protein GspM [Gemmatimonadaceae bacterium]
MSAALSSRDRRVLAIGVLMCFTLVVGTRGVPTLLRWTRETRANATQLSDEAARAQRSVEDAARTRDSLAIRRAQYSAITPRLLEGETAAGAGAVLASLVSSIAAESNVRLGSVQIKADTAHADAFVAIRVHADVIGDVSGLATMLAALERGRTLVAVRELSLAQPDLAAGDDRPEALRGELTVEGLMANPARAPR